MDYYYAILNEHYIVEGVSCLAGEVYKANMIEIDANMYNSDLIGKRYENGEFIGLD